VRPTEESSTASAARLGPLDGQAAAELLQRKGYIKGPVGVVELSAGGVSNVVYRVTSVDRDFVVKQSLPRLRVAEEWLASQERTIMEAEALKLVSVALSDGAPEFLHLDESQFVLVMGAAPLGWVDWRSQLMGGLVNDKVAARVGIIVGEMHRATLGGAGLSRQLMDSRSLEELRIAPYYIHTANVRPESAGALMALVEELRETKRCLVHGDLSPKNIMSNAGSLDDRAWLIDFEAAHFGNPEFDLAFLLSHLTLKAIHLPDLAPGIDKSAREFIRNYSASAGPALEPNFGNVGRHIGALLLARVFGKSPVDYLESGEKIRVARIAGLALEGRVGSLEELFQLRESENR